MVYDLFPFFNELDLLEIRLNVLNDVVDKFVICEAPWTHAGDAKPLHYSENRERFAAFRDKIVHVVADDPPQCKLLGETDNSVNRQMAWVRENWQRNQLVRGLSRLRDDDVVLLSDLDEIPDPRAVLQAVEMLSRRPETIRFGMRFYNFFVNYRNYSVANWPIGTVACTFAAYKDPRTYEGVRPDQFLPAVANGEVSFSKLRMSRCTRVINGAGWHFSYCGGVEAVQTKLRAFAHTELNTERLTDPSEIANALKRGGQSAVCRGYRFFADPIDDSFPAYLRQNRAKYSSLILPVDVGYLRRTRLPRMIAIAQGALYRMMVKLVPSFMVPFALHVRSVLHRRKYGRGLSG